ncbi:unnamed protein product [Strongylus vulgaris]|uniref:Uncharacterized protein n=1 Tax=Strongylus vulgaris TaxID=40348 RepID=A0A3P7K3N5_STRVU|nr:unnamed protein product [Strongylus vulgaris]
MFGGTLEHTIDYLQSETSAQSLPPPTIPHAHQRPPLDRGQSQLVFADYYIISGLLLELAMNLTSVTLKIFCRIQMALNGSANFVGWNDTEGEIWRNWGSKRLRFLAKKYNLNQDRVLTEARSIDAGPHYDVVDHPGPSHVQGSDTNFSFPSHGGAVPDIGTPGSIARSLSQAGSDVGLRPRAERRESVARMAANVAKRGLSSTPRNHRVRLSSRQSFDMDFAESERAGSPPMDYFAQSTQPLFDITPAEEALPYARLIQAGPPRRTGSPIAEESPSELSSLDKESANAAKQEREPLPPVARLDDFEMIDLDVQSIYATASEEQSTTPSDQVLQYSTPPDKSESSETLTKPKLSLQEHVDIDDLFFDFSEEDQSKSRLKAGKERPMTTLMSLPKLPLPSETGSRVCQGGISRLDIGDGRLHIPIGRVALGPVPEEDRAEVNQPDRPLLDAIKPYVRAY